MAGEATVLRATLTHIYSSARYPDVQEARSGDSPVAVSPEVDSADSAEAHSEAEALPAVGD